MRGLHYIDWIVCGVYLAGITAIGLVFYFRGAKTTKEFFLAGRSMGWLPVGLALMASLTSGIGYLGQPAGAVKYGLITLWALTAIPLSYPAVVWVFMPFYHRLKVYTPYEYLEQRFHVSVRAMTSAMFIVWRITWMAAVIYAPSLVMSIVTDNKVPLKYSVIAMGVLSTTYAALGGTKAVMWTDVAQFFVMFGGMILAATLIVVYVPGGLPEIWRTLQESGKTSMTAHIAGWDSAGILDRGKLWLYTDVTAVSLVISATVGKLGNYCVDQALVQRYLTSRDLKTAQSGFLCNCFAYSLYIILMAIVGAGLFAFARHYHFPESLRNDQVFPYFIANVMPIGAAGLLVSGVYAASMSCLTGGINSVITALTNDFYNRFKFQRANLDPVNLTEREQRHHVALARIATVVLGAIETVAALYVGKMGDIYEIANKLINGFIGPLFGTFVLAMFTTRAHTVPVLCAGIVGSIVAGLTIFSKQLELPLFQVGFQWPSVVGLVVTVVIGYGLSVLIPAKTRKDEWTFRRVMGATESGTAPAKADAPAVLSEGS